MPEKIWTGAIYLKEEGGYKIVLKSLRHYRKRLAALGNSPELKDSAAMFASVLNQQAKKTVPRIDEAVQKVQDGMTDRHALGAVGGDAGLLEKALSCYEADIRRAGDTGHEYFVNLVGDMAEARDDLPAIKTALARIGRCSEW